MSNQPTSIHRIVKGEFGNQDPIGAIQIDLSHSSSDSGHWVIYPDGKHRRWYLYKDISNSEFDMIKEFGLMPILDVRYRPIARWFESRQESFSVILMLSTVFCALWGFVLMVAGAFWNSADWMINTIPGTIVNSLLVASMTFSIFSIVACTIAENRYKKFSDDDEAAKRWNDNNSEPDGW